jgi:hypothetical protein
MEPSDNLLLMNPKRHSCGRKAGGVGSSGIIITGYRLKMKISPIVLTTSPTAGDVGGLIVGSVGAGSPSCITFTYTKAETEYS